MDLSGIKVWVFDFDGTLVQSNQIKQDAFDEVVSGFDGGVKQMKEIIASNPQANRYEIFKRFAEVVSDVVQPDDLAVRYGEICEQLVAECDEIPGATLFLQTCLERNLPVYINSATPEDSLKLTITKRGWSNYFEKTLGGPNSKLLNLKKIRDIAGINKNEIVMVGDNEADLEAAMQFGCSFIGVGLESKFANVCGTVSDMNELSDLISRDFTSI